VGIFIGVVNVTRKTNVTEALLILADNMPGNKQMSELLAYFALL